MTRKIHIIPEPIAIPIIAPRERFMAPAIKVYCAEDPSRPSDGAFAGLSLLESKLSEDMAGEALTVVVSVSVTNIVDTAAIAVESLVTVLVKDVVKMPPTELLCGYQN
jgi:hypothetical protein